MNLNVFPQNETTLSLYSDHAHYHVGDSGLDLFMPEDVLFQPGETKIVDLQIKCSATVDGSPVSYMVHPRSSISKTPLRLANSTGIIDAGYRGTLKAALDHIKVFNEDGTRNEEPYLVKAGTRLCQICSPTLSPITMSIVDSLDETARGEGGFGSTGV